MISVKKSKSGNIQSNEEPAIDSTWMLWDDGKLLCLLKTRLFNKCQPVSNLPIILKEQDGFNLSYNLNKTWDTSIVTVDSSLADETSRETNPASKNETLDGLSNDNKSHYFSSHARKVMFSNDTLYDTEEAAEQLEVDPLQLSSGHLDAEMPRIEANTFRLGKLAEIIRLVDQSDDDLDASFANRSSPVGTSCSQLKTKKRSKHFRMIEYSSRTMARDRNWVRAGGGWNFDKDVRGTVDVWRRRRTSIGLKDLYHLQACVFLWDLFAAASHHHLESWTILMSSFSNFYSCFILTRFWNLRTKTCPICSRADESQITVHHHHRLWEEITRTRPESTRTQSWMLTAEIWALYLLLIASTRLTTITDLLLLLVITPLTPLVISMRLLRIRRRHQLASRWRKTKRPLRYRPCSEAIRHDRNWRKMYFEFFKVHFSSICPRFLPLEWFCFL